jgi:hypothetical protein
MIFDLCIHLVTLYLSFDIETRYSIYSLLLEDTWYTNTAGYNRGRIVYTVRHFLETHLYKSVPLAKENTQSHFTQFATVIYNSLFELETTDSQTNKTEKYLEYDSDAFIWILQNFISDIQYYKTEYIDHNIFTTNDYIGCGECCMREKSIPEIFPYPMKGNCISCNEEYDYSAN